VRSAWRAWREGALALLRAGLAPPLLSLPTQSDCGQQRIQQQTQPPLQSAALCCAPPLVAPVVASAVPVRCPSTALYWPSGSAAVCLLPTTMEGMDDTQHQPQQQAAAGASAADSSSSSSSSHAGILAALRAPPSLTAQPAFLSGHNARSPNRHVPAMPAKHSSAAFARPTDGQASSAAAAATAAPAFPSAAASPASSSSASTLGLPQQLKHLLSPPSPRQAKKRSSAQYDVGEAVASAAAPNAMDDKPAAAAPAAVLPPQSKRTRAHSDDDDDDDADDDEDDRDDDGMDDNVRSSGGGSKGRWLEEDADSSFLSLLGKLAKLEFPDQLEQCPCCPEKFPLSEFATHVYTCIQVRQTWREREEGEAALPSHADVRLCCSCFSVRVCRNWMMLRRRSRNNWTPSWPSVSPVPTAATSTRAAAADRSTTAAP